MPDGIDKELLSLVNNPASRFRAELETLEHIRRHLEREIERGKGQGEAGEVKMLRQALGTIKEKIDNIQSKLKSSRNGDDQR